MTVGVLIITHQDLGDSMLRTARKTINYCPLKVETLPIDSDCIPEDMDAVARVMCERLDDGDGVLVLTDLFGSTPSNISVRLLSRDNTEVISGINLSMLIRVMNYPDLSLPDLITKALTGGHDGINLCEKP